MNDRLGYIAYHIPHEPYQPYEAEVTRYQLPYFQQILQMKERQPGQLLEVHSVCRKTPW